MKQTTWADGRINRKQRVTTCIVKQYRYELFQSGLLHAVENLVADSRSDEIAGFFNLHNHSCCIGSWD
jgi:hypothetical protein